MAFSLPLTPVLCLHVHVSPLPGPASDMPSLPVLGRAPALPLVTWPVSLSQLELIKGVGEPLGFPVPGQHLEGLSKCLHLIKSALTSFLPHQAGRSLVVRHLGHRSAKAPDL